MTKGGVTQSNDWSKGSEHAVQLQGVSVQDAMDELGRRGQVQRRLSKRGNSLLAKAGGLTEVKAGETCADATIRFVSELGVLLMDKAPAAVPEKMTFRVVMAPAKYQRGKEKGDIFMLEQRVDGFAVRDDLLAARCVDGTVRAVWGGIFDPSWSPLRKAEPKIHDADEARRAFKALLGSKNMKDSDRVHGWLSIREGKLVWSMGLQRLDGMTGKLLPPERPPEVDHFGAANGGAK